MSPVREPDGVDSPLISCSAQAACSDASPGTATGSMRKTGDPQTAATSSETTTASRRSRRPPEAGAGRPHAPDQPPDDQPGDDEADDDAHRCRIVQEGATRGDLDEHHREREEDDRREGQRPPRHGLAPPRGDQAGEAVSQPHEPQRDRDGGQPRFYGTRGWTHVRPERATSIAAKPGRRGYALPSVRRGSR